MGSLLYGLDGMLSRSNVIGKTNMRMGVVSFVVVCYARQVENTEVWKTKYGNGSAETEVRK